MNQKQVRLPKNLKNIAVFRALQLGDLLCTVPSFRALRQAYPHAKITLIGLPWAQEFVSRFQDYVDNFIPFPGFPGFPEQPPKVTSFPAFLQCMQEQSFDLVLQMQGNGHIANELVQLFNGKITAGFFTEGTYVPSYEYFHPYPKNKHEIHIFLHLLAKLGIPSEGDYLEFPLTSSEKAEASTIIKRSGLNSKNYICVHPGSRSTDRRWDIEKFTLVAEKLSSLGYDIVLTGTEEELPLTQTISQQLKKPPVNLTGVTSLGVTAAVIHQSKLLIANDTGVSHIASALNTPSVILFTGSDPIRWAPLTSSLHVAVDGNAKASVDQVLSASFKLLNPQTTIKSDLSEQKEDLPFMSL